MFGKCSTLQSRVFAALYGGEHPKSSLRSISGVGNIHGDQPKVPTVEFLVDVWNRMNYDFADACLGVRRIIRIPHPGAKSDKFDRLAWGPRADGTPLWQFADTFSLESENGFWQPIISTELERKTESQMITSSLGKSEHDLNLDT